jgi:hypothetical protein
MKIFLIKKDQEKEYTIMKVQENDISSFRQECEGMIVLEADSIQELLISFGAAIKADKVETE